MNVLPFRKPRPTRLAIEARDQPWDSNQQVVPMVIRRVWGGAGVSGGGPAPTTGDPHYANVVALLHFDGSHGSTSIIDSSTSGLTWTAFGNAHVNNADVGYGQALALDGTGDYVGTPANAALNMGSSDFTYEGWVYRTSGSARTGLISQSNAAGQNSSASVHIEVNASNQIEAFAAIGSSTTTSIVSSTLSLNVRYHFAFVRIGGQVELFLNGVSQGTASISGAINSSVEQMRIGMSNFQSTGVTGFMDDVRITKGVGRYASGFTPFGPYPDTTGTAETTYRYLRLLVTSWVANNVDPANTNVRVTGMRFVHNGFDYPLVNMTSNTAPAPLVASDSTGNSPYLAFDGTIGNSSRWITSGTHSSAWLQLDLGAGRGIPVHGVKIAPDDNVLTPSLNYIKAFKVLGSNSGLFAGEEVTLVDMSGLGSWAWTSTAYSYFPATPEALAAGSVSLLLHGEGTNGGTTFTDSSQYTHTFTAVNNTNTSTADKRFGSSSIYFDGSSDGLIGPSGHASFNVGAGDFTIAFWAKFQSVSGVGLLFELANGSSSAANYAIQIQRNGTGIQAVVSNGSGYTGTTAGTVGTSRWHYILFRRNGDRIQTFIDGVLVNTTATTVTVNNPSGAQPRLGLGAGSWANINAYMDDIRFVKGIAIRGDYVPYNAFPNP